MMVRALVLGARAALACAAAVGCGSDSTPRTAAALSPVVDLIATFPATGGGRATTMIDPRDPEAALALTRGWSAPEPGAEGHAVVWMLASRAAMVIEAGASPVDVVMSVNAVTSGDAPPFVVVQVRLNGRPVGQLRLGAGAQEQRVPLSARHQRPGRNTVELIAPAIVGRARPGGAPLRIGVLGVRFETTAERPPAPTVDQGTLFFPSGTSASWFVRVPADARLALGVGPVDRVEALHVSVTSDGGRERIVDVRDPDLRPEAGSVARLAISASAPTTFARLQVLGPGPHAPPPAPGASHPNVVLYVMDTVRADHLGCYGYARPTSPAIDAFARTAVQFDDAVASASWTRPATASILTGRDPAQHGATTLSTGIRPDVPVMAELLHDAGYATGAVVTNLNVASRFGFGRGFDEFRYLEERDERPGTYASAEELNAAAFPWLEAHHDHPFLLYLHASDAHAPYRPAAGQAARFLPAGLAPTITAETPLRDLLRRPALATPDNVAFLAALYDADVAAVDAGVAAVLAKLDALGVGRETLVILVADHGEEFLDHGGLEHGRTLFQEMVHVPLLVRLPGGAGAGRRVPTLARQVDLLPTVLSLAGVRAPGGLVGHPLLTATGEPLPGPDEAVFATELTGRPLAGLRLGTWKGVVDETRERAPAVYDLATDPQERHDLADAHQVLVGYVRQAIEERRLRAGAEAPPRRDTPVADPDTERRLRALGYVEE